MGPDKPTHHFTHLHTNFTKNIHPKFYLRIHTNFTCTYTPILLAHTHALHYHSLPLTLLTYRLIGNPYRCRLRCRYRYRCPFTVAITATFAVAIAATFAIAFAATFAVAFAATLAIAITVVFRGPALLLDQKQTSI